MLGGPYEVLLDGLPRSAKLIRDLLDGVPTYTVHHESRTNFGRQLRQCALQDLHPPCSVGLDGRILALGIRQLREGVGNIDKYRVRRAAQRMLLQDVAGDREEIGFGVTDRVLPLDPQESQENLLGNIGDVVHVTQAHRQKLTQSSPISSGNTRNEAIFIQGQQPNPTLTFLCT